MQKNVRVGETECCQILWFHVNIWIFNSAIITMIMKQVKILYFIKTLLGLWWKFENCDMKLHDSRAQKWKVK